MFTGLVQTLASVVALQQEGSGVRLSLREPALASRLETGESVAVNGCCLTVVAIKEGVFDFQLGPETLSKTNLGELRPQDRVNLERALRVGDPLGGHWVQGHIDGVGQIAERQRQDDWELVWFACPPALIAQMVPKGSVAVDGVSLTVVEVRNASFSVALIPHTLAHTTLGFKRSGHAVNLETDILGKYITQYLRSRASDS